jgi:hypothetical protein
MGYEGGDGPGRRKQAERLVWIGVNEGSGWGRQSRERVRLQVGQD